MAGGRERGRPDPGAAGVGIFLIVVGAFFFAAQALNVDWGRYGWPVFIVVPGLLLLALGLAIPHEGGLGAAIPGGLITAVGLVLAFQSSTDTYESWSYAWALVAPGSVGVTLFLYGLLHRRADLVDSGLRTAAVALGLFVGFGLFFENIVGVGTNQGSTFMRDALPILAVVLGVLIVLWNLLPHPRPERPGLTSDWRDSSVGGTGDSGGPSRAP